MSLSFSQPCCLFSAAGGRRSDAVWLGRGRASPPALAVSATANATAPNGAVHMEESVGFVGCWGFAGHSISTSLSVALAAGATSHPCRLRCFLPLRGVGEGCSGLPAISTSGHAGCSRFGASRVRFVGTEGGEAGALRPLWEGAWYPLTRSVPEAGWLIATIRSDGPWLRWSSCPWGDWLGWLAGLGPALGCAAPRALTTSVMMAPGPIPIACSSKPGD